MPGKKNAEKAGEARARRLRRGVDFRRLLPFSSFNETGIYVRDARTTRT